MVMKNVRNFVVLFSVVMAAVVGNAQIALHGKFQLASETRWGKAVLPAGNYSFTIDSTQLPVRIVIQSTDGKTGAIAQAETSVNAAPGGSYLFITGSGYDSTVRSMNLSQLGMSLIYKPLTRSERETLYAHVSTTVPVQIAKK
jgi:hypothetical protein